MAVERTLIRKGSDFDNSRIRLVLSKTLHRAAALFALARHGRFTGRGGNNESHDRILRRLKLSPPGRQVGGGDQAGVQMRCRADPGGQRRFRGVSRREVALLQTAIGAISERGRNREGFARPPAATGLTSGLQLCRRGELGAHDDRRARPAPRCLISADPHETRLLLFDGALDHHVLALALIRDRNLRPRGKAVEYQFQLLDVLDRLPVDEEDRDFLNLGATCTRLCAASGRQGRLYDNRRGDASCDQARDTESREDFLEIFFLHDHPPFRCSRPTPNSARSTTFQSRDPGCTSPLKELHPPLPITARRCAAGHCDLPER